MSRDLDTLARRAAGNLKAAVESAELASVPPGRPRRRLHALLRPAWVAAGLFLGSTVGLALVIESTPPTTTVAPTTTTIVVTTTVAQEPTTPTTVAAVPVPPSTEAPAPDMVAPRLEIISPEDGAELAKGSVTVVGVTEPGAKVFTGPDRVEVDPSGGWKVTLSLEEGSNLLEFVARDGSGNEAGASVTVYYYAPTTTTTAPPTTTTTKKELAEFSAFAVFGICSLTPPYDVYHGTGEPGSVIEVISEHGSGSTLVGEGGEWEVKVIFETAQPEVAFPVKVRDEWGREAVFEFVYVPEAAG